MKGSVPYAASNMTNSVHSALSGTQTEGGLHNAFTDEATAHVKYHLFAENAKRNGNDTLARLFGELADNELEHAGLIFEYLDGISDDATNLAALIAAEDYAASITYPELSELAASEGFTEISEKLHHISRVEQHHSKLLSEALERLVTPETLPAMMRCPFCGYIHEEGELPDRCPLCSRRSFNFIPL